MADESVGSLASQSPTTQLQSFAEDSVYEDLSIELPDLEETQIIDNEEDQVSVFWSIFSLECMLFIHVGEIVPTIYWHDNR